MKILVLGGYGFIGSHICQQLKTEGHTIGIVDCFHQYYTFPDWEYYPILNQRKQIIKMKLSICTKIRLFSKAKIILTKYWQDVDYYVKL